MVSVYTNKIVSASMKGKKISVLAPYCQNKANVIVKENNLFNGGKYTAPVLYFVIKLNPFYGKLYGSYIFLIARFILLF